MEGRRKWTRGFDAEPTVFAFLCVSFAPLFASHVSDSESRCHLNFVGSAGYAQGSMKHIGLCCSSSANVQSRSLASALVKSYPFALPVPFQERSDVVSRGQNQGIDKPMLQSAMLYRGKRVPRKV